MFLASFSSFSMSPSSPLPNVERKQLYPGNDSVQYFKHSARAYAAGRAFAAGFVNRELQEELGNVHHAVVLVHYYHAARAHHGAYGDKVIVINGDQ
mgnify:CR=1 FL=1